MGILPVQLSLVSQMEHRLAGLLQLKSFIYNLKGGKYMGMTGHANLGGEFVLLWRDVLHTLQIEMCVGALKTRGADKAPQSWSS